MKKNLFVVALVLVGSALWTSAAQADSYGSSGCGLGSVVFQNDNSKLKQVLSATTNGTFWSQTFGISFGTSNCDAGSGKSGALDVYIEANRVALATDVARGQGETLSGLSQILGCQDSATLGEVLQGNYPSLFPSEVVTSSQVSQTIRDVVRTDERLSGSCHVS